MTLTATLTLKNGAVVTQDVGPDLLAARERAAQLQAGLGGHDTIANTTLRRGDTFIDRLGYHGWSSAAIRNPVGDAESFTPL